MSTSRSTLEVFEGVNVPVATIPALLATKILARDDRRRPQDAQDLRALLACATDADLAETERLLTTVTQRGFARNKDLNAELRRAIADFRGA